MSALRIITFKAHRDVILQPEVKPLVTPYIAMIEVWIAVLKIVDILNLRSPLIFLAVNDTDEYLCQLAKKNQSLNSSIFIKT